MSPRKTRKGAKVENVDESLQDVDVSKIPDTPEINRRTLRTRRQLKPKSSSDSDFEQSPKLNESKRQNRRGKGKKVDEIANDSTMNVTITSTRKRTRKDKDNGVLIDNTIINENDNETQEPVSAVKPKVNRSRKRGATKKVDAILNHIDNAENLPNDQHIINNDVSKYLTNENDDKCINDRDSASNEDEEVANVSIKAAKKLGKTPTMSRFLQPRSCNVNSPNPIVTPECSPLPVNLTPHRATKTPRKSPINIGSPKTHSLSPQRLSKTPRKLSVTADSPVSTDRLVTNGILNDFVTDSTLNNSKIIPSKDKNSVLSTRRVSKSPKIVLRTPKSKSPRQLSSKVKNKKSPYQKKNLQIFDNSPRVSSPKKMKSPTTQSVEKTSKSPLLVLDRISPALVISPSENLVTPVITPSALKKLIDGRESPRRQKSIGKKRSPITVCGTPLRPITTLKSGNAKEVSDHLKDTVTSSTPLVQLTSKTKLPITSSTPRERIRRSLNLSPGLGNSPTVSNVPLSVETFYGASSRTSTHNYNDEKSFRIENESNVLITDDDSSFDISGVKAVENSQNDGTSIGNNNQVISTPEKVNKTINDTYELAEPVTPGLKKQNKSTNDTYELDEPITPGLRKRRSLAEANSQNVAENVEEPIPTKRVCRVRFASPPLNSPDKTVSKNSMPSKSNTPIDKGLRKRIDSHVDNINSSIPKSTKVTIRTRRRSNSLTNLRAEIPTEIGMKKRSLSVVDVASRSAQKNLQNESVNRLSKPRLSITSDKKSDVKPLSARKAPNFAQIHQRKFAKMESLVDAKKRVVERHNVLINNIVVTQGASKTALTSTPQMTVTKVTPSDSINGTFNRFGYRIRKEEATKLIKKQPPLSKNNDKNNKRMVLKGVRTNRRFELQMKMRNIDS